MERWWKNGLFRFPRRSGERLLSLVSLFKILFSRKRRIKKVKILVKKIALHCLFFVFIERFIQCLADYRYLSLSNMPFFALPFALSSLIGSRSLGLRTEPASAYPFPRKINGVGGRVGGHDRSFPLINSSVN